ncbi:uncharacterized protein EI90DRAFT_3124119 [Cantharellus anzutake]|uniref:uncharacterized protein n=1 Tax=Cantharellus anzutake TaxID=1750568 RepID=UPI001904EC47|nr:uncharacterized protein EI90DRAFT_3124119 [Cantharellus anzutake]KAF8330884.1 hypothetical protein EI90DRAFT_3124119 [Cantharellus anzutake]
MPAHRSIKIAASYNGFRAGREDTLRETLMRHLGTTKPKDIVIEGIIDDQRVSTRRPNLKVIVAVRVAHHVRMLLEASNSKQLVEPISRTDT